jgi:hypothetical protein
MAKRKQTMQWLKENRQYNGKRKTDNTMTKRKRLFSFSHFIFCFLLAIVLSVFF